MDLTGRLDDPHGLVIVTCEALRLPKIFPECRFYKSPLDEAVTIISINRGLRVFVCMHLYMCLLLPFVKLELFNQCH